MPFATTNKGGFEYNFTRESQFEQLRQKNIDLQAENNELRSSLEELLQVHEELAMKFQQLSEMHQQNENAQEMQRKINLLTQQVETLTRQIQQVQHEKSKTSNARDSQMMNEDKQRTEEVVQILEQLTKSFENVQVNYQEQIDQLQSQINLLKNQGVSNYKKLQQQYNQKIHTFQDVIVQLKRKDEMVNLIETKLKVSQDALRAIIEGSSSQKNQIQTALKNFTETDQNQSKRPGSLSNEEKQNLLNEINEKDRIIQLYKELVTKLRQKIQEKM